MAAPILRAPYGRSAGKTHAHKIPRFFGGVFGLFLWGGGRGEVPRIFLKKDGTLLENELSKGWHPFRSVNLDPPTPNPRFPYWGNPKQHMKLQQPRNYDFWMFQFNLLGSQGGNSREMTTSPPGRYWEVTAALTTAAKLQQVRANSREIASQKLNVGNGEARV